MFRLSSEHLVASTPSLRTYLSTESPRPQTPSLKTYQGPESPCPQTPALKTYLGPESPAPHTYLAPESPAPQTYLAQGTNPTPGTSSNAPGTPRFGTPLVSGFPNLQKNQRRVGPPSSVPGTPVDLSTLVPSCSDPGPPQGPGEVGRFTPIRGSRLGLSSQESREYPGILSPECQESPGNLGSNSSSRPQSTLTR